METQLHAMMDLMISTTQKPEMKAELARLRAVLDRHMGCETASGSLDKAGARRFRRIGGTQHAAGMPRIVAPRGAEPQVAPAPAPPRWTGRGRKGYFGAVRRRHDAGRNGRRRAVWLWRLV